IVNGITNINATTGATTSINSAVTNSGATHINDGASNTGTVDIGHGTGAVTLGNTTSTTITATEMKGSANIAAGSMILSGTIYTAGARSTTTASFNKYSGTIGLTPGYYTYVILNTLVTANSS